MERNRETEQTSTEKKKGSTDKVVVVTLLATVIGALFGALGGLINIHNLLFGDNVWGNPVTSISIEVRPQKTEYIVGEELDTTGLKLAVFYEKGPREIIDSGYYCSPETLSDPGDQEIKVAYSGKETFFEVKVLPSTSEVDTTSSRITIQPYLDVNGQLDGVEKESLLQYGTFDVYINGNCVAMDVNDYNQHCPEGSTYSIKNIRPANGYSFDGVFSGNRTGTVSSDPTTIVLSFSKIDVSSIMETPTKAVYNGHTYCYYRTPATWFFAEAFCRSKGGYLVCVTSSAENEFVKDLIAGNRVWLGATDIDSEGTWKWVSGEPFSYSDWDSDEPNNLTGDDSGSEDFAHYNHNKWNDTVGCLTLGFICEIDHVDDALEHSTEDTTAEVSESSTEPVIEYRYSDYETETSYKTSMPGWTLKDWEWEESDSRTFDYVASWPKGFDTSNYFYRQYNNSPKSESETATDKTEINSTGTAGWIYYHWCRGTYTGGPINRATSPSETSEFNSFHAFFSTTNPNTLTPSSDGDGSYAFANSSCCTDSHWYYPITVSTQSYTTYKKLFTYERWTEWEECEWSSTPYYESDTRRVQTRNKNES